MKRLTALLLTVLLILSLFTACGANSVTQSAPAMKGDYAVEEMAMEAPAAMMDSAANSLSATGNTTASALPENRKWIITVNMEAETEDLDALLPALEEKVADLNGYLEDQDIYNGSSYAARRHRYANLTIRIPAEHVDAFTADMTGIANVVSTDLRREDITLTYVATESKVTALKTEETRLLELLAQAETMSDLLEIEARLSDVRYELESHASRLRLLDNQIDYATVYLYISEVQEYTPVAEKTVGQRIRDGFASSIKGLKDGFVDFVVWILANSPYLVLWGVILVAFIVLKKKLPKKCFCKKHKKAAQKTEETPNE